MTGKAAAVQTAMDAGDIPAIAEELVKITGKVTAYDEDQGDYLIDKHTVELSTGRTVEVETEGPDQQYLDENGDSLYGDMTLEEIDAVSEAVWTFNVRVRELYDEWGIWDLERRAWDAALASPTPRIACVPAE